ncbi:hypothetical protein IMCC3317_44160 [Kordia antarctica]|uniref:Uncharacterized protein n=1 Tax=Kordia antarctica TaxID=1218801 RepID=A0A7L4ZSD3_9FLAO|nr:hypothetical protein [Kordia antarctica]QHI39016.1 hypothetical protein IMCC3317_44160 [Kordia antarctica]
MKMIQKFVLAITLLIAVQISAQETENIAVENFKLPSFSELSTDIATDYYKVRESLPNLSNIGEHVQKEIRRGFYSENSITYTFRNFTDGNSLLPNISPQRFQLRNNLNTIMFNGFDANQMHFNGAYKRAN